MTDAEAKGDDANDESAVRLLKLADADRTWLGDLLGQAADDLARLRPYIEAATSSGLSPDALRDAVGARDRLTLQGIAELLGLRDARDVTPEVVSRAVAAARALEADIEAIRGVEARATKGDWGHRPWHTGNGDTVHDERELTVDGDGSFADGLTVDDADYVVAISALVRRALARRDGAVPALVDDIGMRVIGHLRDVTAGMVTFDAEMRGLEADAPGWEGREEAWRDGFKRGWVDGLRKARARLARRFPLIEDWAMALARSGGASTAWDGEPTERGAPLSASLWSADAAFLAGSNLRAIAAGGSVGPWRLRTGGDGLCEIRDSGTGPGRLLAGGLSKEDGLLVVAAVNRLRVDYGPVRDET